MTTSIKTNLYNLTVTGIIMQSFKPNILNLKEGKVSNQHILILLINFLVTIKELLRYLNRS